MSVKITTKEVNLGFTGERGDSRSRALYAMLLHIDGGGIMRQCTKSTTKTINLTIDGKACSGVFGPDDSRGLPERMGSY